MVSFQFGTMKNKNTFDNEPRNIASFQFLTVFEGERKEKVISTVQQYFFPSFSFMTFLLIFIFFLIPLQFRTNYGRKEKQRRKSRNWKTIESFTPFVITQNTCIQSIVSEKKKKKRQ